MAELKNDDLLLVNRDETTYTAPGEAIYGSYLTKPVIDTVELVESNPGVLPRFTDQDFIATVTMAEEGQPLSEKKFDAFVEGNILDDLETSIIIDNKDNSYVANLNEYAIGGSPEPYWVDAPLMFNGDLSTFGYLVNPGSPTKARGQFNLPLTGVTKLEIYIPSYGANKGQKYAKDMRASTGSVTSTTGEAWLDLTSICVSNGEVTTIAVLDVSSGDIGAFCAIRVNGEVLIEGEVTLNLADDTNISSLVVGEEIQQDSAGTPVTSAITDVTELDGTWISASAVPNTNLWLAVAYGNSTFGGMFCAVAGSGTNRVMTSYNGIDWNPGFSGGKIEENQWRDVVFGGDKFVAVADTGNNRISYADKDAAIWTPVQAPGGTTWKLTSVTYGKGKFVACGTNGTPNLSTVMYSDDGIVWEIPPGFNYPGNLFRVAYGNGMFVALSRGDALLSNQVIYSPDGITWTTTSAASSNEGRFWQGLAYGNGVFVAVSTNTSGRSDGSAMYSPDGINWTAAPDQPSLNSQWFHLSFGDGGFVAVSDKGYDSDPSRMTAYSTDGITWLASPAAEDASWQSSVYGGDKFVAVSPSASQSVMWSYTGTGVYQELLNFTDDTNLANFRVGDIVQEVKLESPVGYAVVTSSNGADAAYPNTANGDVVGVVGSCALDTSSTAVQRIPDQPEPYLNTRYSHLVFDLINSTADFTFYANTGGLWQISASNDGVNWFDSGSGQLASPVSIRSLLPAEYANSRYVMVSYVLVGFGWETGYSGLIQIEFNQAFIDAYAQPFPPASIPGISSANVKILEISESSSTITTDGGDWSNGETITGGTYTATGTLASATDTTITVNASSGRWLVTKDDYESSKKLNKKAVQINVPVDGTKKYLKFNRNGDVETLLDTPQSPPYLTTDEDPTLTFKFPSTFPSGFTPDEELGEGTTLTVEVTASNTIGSDGPKSDTVQPEVDPLPPNVGLVTLYTGNGEVDPPGKELRNGINFLNNGGLLWMKPRISTTFQDHILFDTLRAKIDYLKSNSTEPENYSGYVDFLENGANLVNSFRYNAPGGVDYVAWSFQKAPNYFDLFTYIGDGSSSRTIEHDLGGTPGMIIIKGLEENKDWEVYTSGTGTYSSVLNRADLPKVGNYWGDVNSSSFTMTNASALGNATGKKYVVYLFANDGASSIKCGTSSGPNEVTGLGFKPQWVMMKGISSVESDWHTFDSKRGNNNDIALNSNIEEFPRSFELTDDGFINSFLLTDYFYIAISEPPPIRSLTAEELEEQKLKFLTYDNRKEVVCGEEATAVRAELLATLIEAGYDAADIAQAYSNLDN